jgi:arylsulfatase A
VKPEEGIGQLYDLDADPGETRDLAAENPTVVADLKALLDKYKNQGFSRPMKGKAPGSS